MDSLIKTAIIGTDERAFRAGMIINELYNKLAGAAGADKLSVDYYVALWDESDDLKYSDINGVSVIPLSDVKELFNLGRIEAVIVPQGVSSYSIPILTFDDIPEEAICCMENRILDATDTSQLKLDDLLRGYNEVGFLHPELPLEADTQMRYLGKKKHTCAICHETGEYNSYLAREMMQNKRDEFEYFVCSNCFCLQIAEVPDNLGDYYGENYYSFSLPEDPDRKYATPVNNMDRILDVGCGSGVWLVQMAESGFGNLHGADPFLSHEIRHGDRVHIRNCSIHDLDESGAYDFIRFSDSFEHVTDPHEVFASAHRLLKDDGVIEIKIPTYPNIAFDIFGAHWYQLDAPRHISLHSVKSIRYLAKGSGLRIKSVKYNSNETQLYRSLLYMHNVPFFETDKNAEKYLLKSLLPMRYLSQEADKRFYGDHMVVLLEKDI